MALMCLCVSGATGSLTALTGGHSTAAPQRVRSRGPAQGRSQAARPTTSCSILFSKRMKDSVNELADSALDGLNCFSPEMSPNWPHRTRTRQRPRPPPLVLYLLHFVKPPPLPLSVAHFLLPDHPPQTFIYRAC